MKALLRNARIAPMKASLVAGMVRGKTVNEALEILRFAPKKAAKLIYKVVHSAASNARNNFNQNWDDLVITRLLVTKGSTLKRWLPVSRGRSHPILKHSSHITVEVGVTNQKTENRKQETAVKKTKAVVAKKLSSKTRKS